MDGQRLATCRKLFEPGGVRYQFFCDLSGALVCTTALQPEDDPGQAWWREGRPMFSQCQRCGRWVSDPMYNAETMQCVQCSPWEEQPAFCPQCGKKVAEDATFCHCCRARLRYADEGEYG